MVTFKQLETLYWIERLGGFAQAANKLNTSQSAISKRIQELELLAGVPLFDRTGRSSRLTAKGEEMLAIARKLLNERDTALEQFLEPEVIEKRIRIGVTELTAMTWLPRFVGLIQHQFPKVVLEPDVDTSSALRAKLLSDSLDLIVVPQFTEDRRITTRRVGKVSNTWMCKPGVVDNRRALRVHELAQHRLLMQGEVSGTGAAYGKWLRQRGVTPRDCITSNNLIAIISMTVAGLGVSHLPRDCLRPMIDAGQLAIIKTTPALPDITYAVAHRPDDRSSLVSSLVTLAQESCDFSTMYQTEQEP